MAMVGKFRRKRFGEILVAEKLVTQDQVNEALEVQKNSGDALGNILLDLGHIDEGDILKALSIQYQIPCLTTSNYELDAKLAQGFEPSFLHRYKLLPFDRIGNLLLLLATDIPGKEVMAAVQEKCQSDIALYLGTRSDVHGALMDMCPIPGETLEKLRRDELAAKTRPETREAVRRKESGEADMKDLDLSSEQILSSLDQAWDSIFVDTSEVE